MTAKTYPAYQDSGADWLGAVPTTWAVERLRNGFDLQKRSVLTDDGTVTAFRNGEVTLRSNRRVDGYTEADEDIGYQGIEPGDLVIHAMDAFAGAIGVSDARGKCSPVYSVCSARTGYDAHYYAYALRHIARSGYVSTLGNEVRERSTDFRWNDARNLLAPVPPIQEQVAIVAFLNAQTTKLDALIEKQKQLIETLAERRQAAINQAVSMGLDPSAPLKDTGDRWIPKLPAHWKLVPCGSASNLIQTGPFGSHLHSRDYVSDGTPVINPSHIINGEIVPDAAITVNDVLGQELSRHRLQEGDIVAARRGDLGRAAVVHARATGYLCGTGSIIIRLKPGAFVSAYFLLAFGSTASRAALAMRSVRATMNNLTPEIIARLCLPAPPLAEQHDITDYLKRETTQIDTLAAKAHEVIEVLKERRLALISAAVTGRMDVRRLT